MIRIALQANADHALRGRKNRGTAQYHDAASGSVDRPMAQADVGGRVILSMSCRVSAGSSKSRINLSFES
jgi:hypothetical protein